MRCAALLAALLVTACAGMSPAPLRHAGFNLASRPCRRSAPRPAVHHPGPRAILAAQRHPSPQLVANGIDEKLVAADVTLIFAFAFARTLGQILTSPTFPGWLAPITADPVRLGTTIQFASLWTLFWVLAATVADAFDPGVDQEARRNIGPASAGRAFALAAALYATAAGGVSATFGPDLLPPALQLDLNNMEGGLGLGLSLAAWRAVLQETIPR